MSLRGSAAMRSNPKKLNALQLKTLAILQAMAAERDFADPPDRDGTVLIHSMPHAHGDHFHVGPAAVLARDTTGLDNPNVMNALARKGLLLGGPAGLPVLTPEGLAYDTGIAAQILHQTDHSQ
jgi:hypothetical protein